MTQPRIAIAVGVVAAILCLQWHVIDNAPPTFDDASYLASALNEFNAWRTDGFTAFYKAFLTVDPGRGGLLFILAQPGFWMFGTGPDAAFFAFYLLWPLATWAMFDFTRNVAVHGFKLDDHRAAVGGIMAAILFATHPWTLQHTTYFRTEFPLIVCVALAYAASYRFFLTGGYHWATVLGIAILGASLAKVNFAMFLLAPAAFVVARWVRATSWGEFAVSLALLTVPFILVAAPFYVVNWHAIVETTRWLTSAQTAAVYGLGGAGDWSASITAAKQIAFGYPFLLPSVAAVITISWAAVHRDRRTTAIVMLLTASFAIPFAVVMFSNFKLERYAYPGYVPLFVLGAVGFGLVWRGPARLAISAAFIPGFINVAAVNSILPDRKILDWPFFSGGIPLARADARDWSLANLVHIVEARAPNGPIMILGGSIQFNSNLLTLTSMTDGASRQWTEFPYQVFPNAVVSDMIAVIERLKPTAVVLKTPPYYMFMGKFAPDAVAHLRDVGYIESDLPYSLPDGSRFTLFLMPDVQSK